jgi:hypothetical protein
MFFWRRKNNDDLEETEAPYDIGDYTKVGAHTLGRSSETTKILPRIVTINIIGRHRSAYTTRHAVAQSYKIPKAWASWFGTHYRTASMG